MEALKELSQEELSSRLYKMCEFEQGKGGNKIKLKHHLTASANTELNKVLPTGYKEAAPFGEYEEQPLLRLTSKNWNFAIEGKDFET